MTTAPTPPRITNQVLGEILGLDHSSVSRLRRGERGCSVAVMVRVEDMLNWPVREQYAAMTAGTFGTEFERRVTLWASTRPGGEYVPTAS